MIIGTGIDIIETDRLKKCLDKHGDAFLKYYLTPEEIAALPSGLHRLDSCAGRWAAKEAIAKALGTGFGTHCSWQDIRILNDPLGRPIASLTGNARKTAAQLNITKWHISISHEIKFACAMAIAEGND